MAPKKGAKKVNVKLDLAAVVNCGEPGYIFTFPDEHAELLAAGYVQVNPELKDENGAIATAATQAGIDFINSQNGAPAAPKEVKIMDAFVIETSSEMPATGKRGGGRSTVYPFDQLPAPGADATRPTSLGKRAGFMLGSQGHGGCHQTHSEQTDHNCGHGLPVDVFQLAGDIVQRLAE